MVSPRRSGRTTSTPADRSSRWHPKMSPRQKSPTPGNLSDDNAIDDSRPTRRATRAQNPPQDDIDNDSQAIDADDEVTRCVCGLQDYPGPPLADHLPPITDAAAAEDAGGLFIQCDKCHVWQHGGCVGIMDETKSPENYFCELCDKKFHSVMTDSKGQRYSRYLPLFPAYKPEVKNPRKSSITKETESAKARKDREAREAANRASVESSAGKRRSTMNSRQAYDDEETLRRVIEETKGEDGSMSTLRKNKRSRADSEDSKHEIKRQRTGSDSPDPPSTLHTASQAAESDDDAANPRSNKKIRNTVTEALRQKEARERERQRDMKRAEAAGRRSERAGRRRGDDSEPLEDTSTVSATADGPTSRPPSPPASAIPQAPGSSHKKGAQKKQKRLGRNQYSAPKPATSPNRPKSQPTLPPTNQSSGDDPTNSTTESKNSPSSINETVTAPVTAPTKPKTGKWGRGKNQRQAPVSDPDAAANNKDREKSQMTLTDMKKRTGMMMDYIAKSQVDMSGERTPLNGGGPVQPPQQSNQFKELSSREMMDVLSRQIAAWQKEYGGETVSV